MIWKVLGSMIAGAITFALGSVSFAQDLSACTYTKFKVTAYYSPLQGQDFYYKGNFEDEVILNGKGTHGASGRAVFNGMLAAPSSYEFGSVVYFPGWGIGQIEDRGGAIVHKGERGEDYDRIDIWAGKGEEGLMRALSFGVQYLEAYVCAPGHEPAYVGFSYDQFPSYDHFFHSSLWIMSLWPGRQDEWVRALQDYLIAMGYMAQGRNTGYFGAETKAGVCAFQQDWIGMGADSIWCGYFGPQTRYAMKYRVQELGLTDEAVKGVNLPFDDESEEGIVAAEVASAGTTEEITIVNAGQVELQEPKTLDERIIDHLFTHGEFKHYRFLNPLKKGDQTKEVRILQRKLQRLGYLGKVDPISGIYDNGTIEAVYQFQLDNSILYGHEDVSLQGFFGPKTRDVLNTY